MTSNQRYKFARLAKIRFFAGAQTPSHLFQEASSNLRSNRGRS